jgi:hypothetical protein
MIGMRDEQHPPERARRGPRAGVVGVQLGDLDVAGAVGEVDVEQPGALVVGREGHREQASLAARRDRAGDVGEGLPLAASDQADPPAALDHEDPADAGSRGYVGRALEMTDPLQLHPLLGAGVVRGDGEGEQDDRDGRDDPPHPTRR